MKQLGQQKALMNSLLKQLGQVAVELFSAPNKILLDEKALLERELHEAQEQIAFLEMSIPNKEKIT